MPMFEEMKGRGWAAWTALLTLAHPGMEGRSGTSRCRCFQEQGPQVWGQANGQGVAGHDGEAAPWPGAGAKKSARRASFGFEHGVPFTEQGRVGLGS